MLNKKIIGTATWFFSWTFLNLSACTGGGLEAGKKGGKDTQGPLIVDVSPKSGIRTGLAKLLVAYNEPLDPRSIQARSITATGSTGCYPAVNGVSAVGGIASYNLALSGCVDGSTLAVSVDPSLVTDVAGNPGTGSLSTRNYTYRTGAITLSANPGISATVYAAPTSFTLTMSEDALSATTSAIVKSGTCASSPIWQSPQISGADITFRYTLSAPCATGTSLAFALNATQVRNLSNVAGTATSLPFASYTIDRTAADIMDLRVNAASTTPNGATLTASPQYLFAYTTKPVDIASANNRDLLAITGTCVANGHMYAQGVDVGASPDQTFFAITLQPLNGGCRSGETITFTVRPNAGTPGNPADDLYDVNGNAVTVSYASRTYTIQ